MNTSVEYSVKFMCRKHVDGVMQLEKKYAINTLTENQIINMMRKSKIIGLVVMKNEEVVGYAIYELNLKYLYVMRFMADLEDESAEILFNGLVKKINTGNLFLRNSLKFVIPVSDFKLVEFLVKKCRCRIMTTIKEYFFDPTEDGYFIQYIHLPNGETF